MALEMLAVGQLTYRSRSLSFLNECSTLREDWIPPVDSPSEDEFDLLRQLQGNGAEDWQEL